jgi:O-antigen ligase
MTAASTSLRPPVDRSLLAVLAVLGIAALGVAGGVSVALGELEAFYICVSVLAAAAVLYDFRVGALLLIVMLPLAGTRLFPHSLMGITGANPLNLVLAATLFSLMLRMLAEGRLRGFMPRPLLWLYIVPLVAAGIVGAQYVDYILPTFYATGLLSFHEATGYFRDIVLKPLITVLAALAIAAAVARSTRPEAFLAPIILAVWLIVLIAMGYVLVSGVRVGTLASATSRHFLSGIGLHANDLGRLYAIAYALLLFTWAETKHPALRTTLLASMAVLAGALILTFSRGAFFGFLVVNLLFVLWRFNVRAIFVLALAGIAAVLLLPGVMQVVLYRVTVGFDGDLNALTAGRWEGIWLPLIPEFWRAPFFGSGLASILWSEPLHAGTMLEVGHPHNAFLEALLDMGMVGLALLLAYYLHVWSGMRRLARSAALSPTMRGFFQGGVAGLIAHLATGMAGSSLLPRPEHAFLWVAIGMMYGLLSRRPAS